MSSDTPPKKSSGSFRVFFFRGLGILLPTVLTIWIVVAAYRFVEQKIAVPINAGTRELIIQFSPWPEVTAADIERVQGQLNAEQLATMKAMPDPKVWLLKQTRRVVLMEAWNRFGIGHFVVMDLLGLAVAIILIYIAGVSVGSFVGRKLYRAGEHLIERVPVINAVYPHVKQVTDFLFGDAKDSKLKFSRVVAVQYPRIGLWSLGLVTGDTLRDIQQRAGAECVTVFVPSSPTPFTGYVITVPKSDTIDLDISIDDALRFTISGGVIVPTSQLIGMAPSEENSKES